MINLMSFPRRRESIFLKMDDHASVGMTVYQLFSKTPYSGSVITDPDFKINQYQAYFK